MDIPVIDQSHSRWCCRYSLKFFILSRPEDWIKWAFDHVSRSLLLQEFILHDVAKSDVQRDIDTYVRSALSDIAMARGHVHHDPSWPPEQELEALLIWFDGLFIHAATAIRYISAQGVNSRRRLTEILRPQCCRPALSTTSIL